MSWKTEFNDYLIAPERIKSWAQEMRREGHTIVTTNGSFDLLHAGHVHTLFEGKKLGGLFIVLLNSDASVRSYKGESRPIIELKYRLQLVAALRCVDFVSYFDEPDPRRILAEIAPDIHVNSAEYGEDCIERETIETGGGRVQLVEKIDSLSTSAIIKKIESCRSLQH